MPRTLKVLLGLLPWLGVWLIGGIVLAISFTLMSVMPGPS